MFCFISCTDFHDRHVGAPKSNANMADANESCNFLKIFFYNFVLETAVEPEIILIVSFHLPFRT